MFFENFKALRRNKNQKENQCSNDTPKICSNIGTWFCVPILCNWIAACGRGQRKALNQITLLIGHYSVATTNAFIVPWGLYIFVGTNCENVSTSKVLYHNLELAPSSFNSISKINYSCICHNAPRSKIKPNIFRRIILKRGQAFFIFVLRHKYTRTYIYYLYE